MLKVRGIRRGGYLGATGVRAWYRTSEHTGKIIFQLGFVTLVPFHQGGLSIPTGVCYFSSIPAGGFVHLEWKLRAHHIGQAPGPAGVSPHLPKLSAGAEGASVHGCLWLASFDTVQECHCES